MGNQKQKHFENTLPPSHQGQKKIDNDFLKCNDNSQKAHCPLRSSTVRPREEPDLDIC